MTNAITSTLLSAGLAGFFIGLAAVVAGVLAWRIHTDVYRKIARYEREMDVEFWPGCLGRKNGHKRLEGIDARKN